MDPYSLQSDLETTRVIELENNKLYIKRDGPHGFWRLNLDKGQLPEKYRGEYTAIEYAKKAANEWISSKKKITVSEKV